MCLDQMQHSPSALPSSKDGLFYNVGLGYNHYAVMFRLEETTSQKTKTHATHATHATHIPSVAEWLSNTTGWLLCVLCGTLGLDWDGAGTDWDGLGGDLATHVNRRANRGAHGVLAQACPVVPSQPVQGPPRG
ncbi:hypothetical protein AUP68_12381 [Ilyonectria robusta]